jgi:hypothetical protein
MAVGFIWPFTFFDYFATDLPSPPEAGQVVRASSERLDKYPGVRLFLSWGAFIF